MHKVVLDTDVFSEIAKGRNAAVAKRASSYRQQFGQYTVTVITVMEIVKGFQKSQRADRVQSFLTSLVKEEILLFDCESAEFAGAIHGDLARLGQSIGRVDPIVAAIAIRNRLPLVTGNRRHFERICALGYPLILEDWHH